ncbi:FHA domain-containing protein [Nocardia carnea]|uniref:FHA domain-containing protein n=1 Tax=Nocardia carnea TaxID=37328 RepID=A0ABW7TPX9_9NOCA|nr:FHA domain-containing protein [Nocardia carnea]
MQDQQVEVVPGSHAVARVAGAVVLVAHRGTGRPTADSPAVRALVALAELVYEATAREPEGPGATIARHATRWLTANSAQAGPGTPADFGILSAAGPGRVAIFLHGAVTAVVAGATTEYFHGRDAAFTVDRTTSVPSHAVALFVDDPLADPDDDAVRPELPAARGIGRLVEGIAEAGGAIAWAPAVRRTVVPAEPSRGSGVVLGKEAVRGGREQPAEPQVTPEASAPGSGTANVPVSAAGSSGGTTGDPEVDGVPESAVESAVGASRGGLGAEGPQVGATRGDPMAEPGKARGPAVDSVQLSERATVASSGDREQDSVPPAATDPHHAETEISSRQPPRASPPGEGLDETADSLPNRAGPRRPAYPTPRRDIPVPQPGQGEQSRQGPPERGTPPLDPELRRRTEATAKGAALTVKVRGFKCARAHPTDPRSAFCSVCGMPVDQTQPLIEVMRPPLGILVLDDGSTYLLETDSVLGRDPEKSEPARRGLTPLQITDNSGGMSRAHAELLLVEWDVTLVDRGSTNGTRARAPGFREWARVPPHQPMVLVPGTEILIGNRMLRFESAAPPPFGS